MVALAGSMRVLSDWRRQAETAAHGSPIYNWLLSSGSTPRRLAVKMIDPWPGHADIARSMCKGLFTPGGASIPFAHDLWEEAGQYPQWKSQLHGFTWLRDLRALGGDQCRRLARQMVDGWIARNDRWDADIWTADMLGQRIAMWLSTYDFFCGSADDQFQERYFASLTRQTKHLSRIFPAGLHGLPLLRAAKGLIFAGLAFGRETWAAQGAEAFLRELPRQILKDGGHVSRSPQALAEAMLMMLDLRCALYRSNLPVPDVLQKSIERAGGALKFFRYADRKLALFQGGQQGDAALLDAIQSHIPGNAIRAESCLRNTGYERVSQGRSVLLLDTGSVPAAPYDRVYHSAPLAFEFSYGRDRIFSNCGSHPSHPDWKQVLRHTAAHNALTLNGRPVHEFTEDGNVRASHSPIICARSETRESCLLDAEHNGYARAGVIHRRRFYLSRGGCDLRGEDSLTSGKVLTKRLQAEIRFHLDPKVIAVAGKSSDEVRLILPGGTEWVFFAVEAKIALENSISFASGIRPAKTRQIVITAPIPTDKMQIKWALQKQ